jgi:hypothetical protein
VTPQDVGEFLRKELNACRHLRVDHEHRAELDRGFRGQERAPDPGDAVGSERAEHQQKIDVGCRTKRAVDRASEQHDRYELLGPRTFRLRNEAGQDRGNTGRQSVQADALIVRSHRSATCFTGCHDNLQRGRAALFRSDFESQGEPLIAPYGYADRRD